MGRQKLVQAAEREVRRGRLEAAIAEYRKVLDLRPDDTRTLNRIGDLYLRVSKVEEAVGLFSRAADHFSDEGFFVKAIAIYKKIIRVDPTRIEVYERLADLYRQQGLTNEARSQYQVVGDYYYKKGDQDSVISILRKLVDLEPEDARTRLKLAETYHRGGSVPEAVEQYREIAELMLEHNRVQDAVRVYTRALEVAPGEEGVLASALSELERRGFEAAAEELKGHAERLGAAAPGGEPQDAEMADTGELPSIEEVLTVPDVEVDAGVAEAAGVEEDTRPAEPEPAPAAAVGGPVEEPEVDLGATQAVEIDIDLGDLDAAAAEEAEAEAEPAEAPAPESEPPATAPVEEDKAQELVAEARVLASYGLEEKAIQRYEEALAVDPTVGVAYLKVLELHLARGRAEAVVEAAGRALQHLEGDDPAAKELLGLLRDGGYEVDGDSVAAPPEGPETAAPKADEPTAAAPEPPEPEVPEAAAGAEEPPPGPAVEEPKEPIPAAEEPQPAPVVEEPKEPAPGGAAEVTGLGWLDELTAERADVPATAEASLRAEEEFFDLAAELEHELRSEEDLGSDSPQRADEQTLEEIVEGFRKGVAETLSREDYDTHYDLGIAYREMGLLDEAIGEFQLAAKDPRFLVECCSLLGLSFAEKGFEELAIKWYERGLESPRITEEEKMGLLYELGNLYLSSGNRAQAKETFVEIYGANSNYRDVVAKLEELRQEK